MSRPEGATTWKPIEFDNWGAINQLEALRLARDPTVKPMAIRLFFASLAHANKIGHAPLAPGQLSKMMSRPHRSDPGKMHAPGSQQLCGGIERAIDMGLLEPDSGILCLRPNMHLWQKRGGRGARTCGKHHILR